jgi:hypothetical protein
MKIYDVCKRGEGYYYIGTEKGDIVASGLNPRELGRRYVMEIQRGGAPIGFLDYSKFYQKPSIEGAQKRTFHPASTDDPERLEVEKGIELADTKTLKQIILQNCKEEIIQPLSIRA